MYMYICMYVCSIVWFTNMVNPIVNNPQLDLLGVPVPLFWMIYNGTPMVVNGMVYDLVCHMKKE